MADISSVASTGPFWALLGATFAASLGGVGSSLGVGIAGQAATGLSAEKPELATKAAILEALPGAQAIYGFVAAFAVLFILFSGKTTQLFEIDAGQGLQIFAACIPVGLTGLFSAIVQGKIVAGGMNMMAKDPSSFSKVMIMGAIVETFAIIGLLSSFLMILEVGKGIV